MPSLLSLPLAPLGALYGAMVRARMRLYRAGALATKKVNVPVISIGNITAGGTGKTPLVAWAARAIANEGLRVCVLTRGYGRADESKRVVVSDGTRVLADAREGGDEPCMLAEMLIGKAAVVSDRDRAAAAHWAIENLDREAFILDDGFQHLSLARDLDIVTVDATDAWGGKCLLPRGRLREPLRGLARADCIVITRADQAHDLSAVVDEAKHLSEGHATVITARARASRIAPLSSIENDNLRQGIAELPQSFAAFCAIGNPRSFFTLLRAEGHELACTKSFSDHHRYTQRDADMLSQQAVACGARALITTAKDAVKLTGLRFSMPCYVCEIELEFSDEARLREILRATIARIERNNS